VSGLQVGDVVRVTVGDVAHGGHCVARHEGQVLFVRHTLPGEVVEARVTEVGSGAKFVRADAVAVLSASPARVEAPCPYAGPGRCGGCDWQHATLEEQRRLKARVVVEQFARLARTDVEAQLGPVVCEAVPGDQEGLRWRTRVELALRGGRPGLRVHRSHEVVPVDDCLIAHPGVVRSGVFDADPARGQLPPTVVAVDVVAPSVGAPVVVPLAPPAPRRGPSAPARGGRRRRDVRDLPVPLGPVPAVTERVGDHEFVLSARGFWQVHPGAATTFTDQVLRWLDPQPGERALDLYAGVGLFAVPLAERVGPTGTVLAVEADREAAASAAAHLEPWPWASSLAAPTEWAVTDLVASGERADVVVLDPPRTGAGRAVVDAIAQLGPRAVVYVACDPAALARDVAFARGCGLELAALRVLDAFPMTQHMECLALLVPA
jgi:tRNA/tmRNA/rRNA uracil-C5-methylase (TrmA/RlmC/RlmD family)